MEAFVNATRYVKDGMIVGLGSGSTVAMFLDYLKDVIEKDSLHIKFIPTSLQIKLKAEELGFEIVDNSFVPRIDLTYDGADEIDENLNMIKGGGGALLKEKVVINSSKMSIILAQESKFVDKLKSKVPIEVLPFAKNYVIEELKKMDAKPQIRLLNKGYPFITENGNIILDTDFGVIEDPLHLELKVKSIPGVLEVGIFSKVADLYYKLKEDGSFEVIKTRHI